MLHTYFKKIVVTNVGHGVIQILKIVFTNLTYIPTIVTTSTPPLDGIRMLGIRSTTYKVRGVSTNRRQARYSRSNGVGICILRVNCNHTPHIKLSKFRLGKGTSGIYTFNGNGLARYDNTTAGVINALCLCSLNNGRRKAFAFDGASVGTPNGAVSARLCVG